MATGNLQLLPLLKLTNTRGLQAFQFLRFGGLFITSVLVARLLTDKSEVALFETLLLIGSSTTFFWVSGIINPFIPLYTHQMEDKRKGYFTSAAVLMICFSILTTFLAFVWLFIHPPKELILYYIFLVGNLLAAPAFLNEYFLLLLNKPKTILIYGIVGFLLQFYAIALPLFLFSRIEVALVHLLILNIGKFIFLLFLIMKYDNFFIDFSIIRILLKKCIPSILTLLIGGSMAFTDSYFIRYYFNDNDFAIFRYGARELPFVLLLANAFSNVMSGEVALANREGTLTDTFSKIKTESAKLMHYLFPLTIVLLFSSAWLYKTVYTEAYMDAFYIFNIYLLLILSRLVFPQTILLGLQKNVTLLKLSVVEWTLNLTFNFTLLYFWGMYGVALATVLSFMSEKILQSLVLAQQGIKPSKYIPMKTWLIYSIITVCSFAAVWWMHK